MNKEYYTKLRACKSDKERYEIVDKKINELTGIDCTYHEDYEDILLDLKDHEHYIFICGIVKSLWNIFDENTEEKS